MDYNEILMTLITMVVVPAIGIVGNAIYKAIQENVKDKRLQKYLIIANDCVTDAVADVAQTTVDKIKSGKLDGKTWNKETKEEVFELAKTKALEHLGITGKTLLDEALGDFDGWVNSKVQAEVKRLELNQKEVK